MLQTLSFSLNAVAPILLLTALGFLLRRSGLLTDGFLTVGNRLVFQVCLPVLLFCNVYDIDGLETIRWDLVGLALITTLLFFVLGLGLARLFVPQRDQKGVLIQCAFRSNFAIIGLPLSTALGGAAGTATAALLSAFTIPVFNVLAVVALSLYTGASRPTARQLLGQIARNPLIRGVGLGLVVLGLRTLLPRTADGAPVISLARSLPFVFDALSSVGALASPLALLVLGGQFRLDAVGSLRRQLTLGVLTRTVLAPVVGLGLAWLTHRAGLVPLDAGGYAALTALYGSPVAVSSAIMAGQMHNDAQLAGQLVVWSSLCSGLTLFLLVFALRQLGLV